MTKRDIGTRKRKIKPARIIIALLICIFLTAAILILDYFNLIPKKSYTAKDFGITPVLSGIDKDGDGIDDYTDIMQGARAFVAKKPPYKSVYYEGGYPTDENAVCTDVVWSAFKNAGYMLKDMVDADIAANPEAYFTNSEKPDPNIDFRRVRNLRIYFKRTALSLTLDASETAEWQPGDIVTYSHSHIAIVSDKRNADGTPYIIHHGGQPVLEEDALTRSEIDGHFRIKG